MAINVPGVVQATHAGNRRGNTSALERESQFDIVLVAVFLFLTCLRMTHLHVLFGPIAQPALLAIEFSVSLFYVFKSATRWNYKIVFVAFAYLAFLVFEVFNFERTTGIDANINSIFQYISILMIVVFYESKLSLRTLQKIILYISIGYLLIHGLLNDQILAAAPADSSLIRPADGIREDRVALATGLATFPLIVGIFSFRRAPFKSVSLIGLSSVSIILGESRAFSAALAIGVLSILLGLIFPKLRSTVNLGMAFIFLLLSIYLILPIIGVDYNPYEPFLGDSSGRARYLQYKDGLDTLGNRYLGGIGIASSTDALQSFVNPVRPFFTSDLGAFGLAYEFGLPFTFLFMALSVAFIVKPVVTPHGGRALALFHAVQLQAFLGFFSAVLLNSTATIFAALTVAGWMRYRSPSRTLESPLNGR